MSHRLDGLSTLDSWTNGRKAVVQLVGDASGFRAIRKQYRVGFTPQMHREFLMTSYAASRTSICPSVLSFRPWTRELFIEYLPGERVLEWVLERFGDDLDLAAFKSFHGLDPNRLDPRVATAFSRFRESDAPEVRRLKSALQTSYSVLHRAKLKHGSADPRNVLYHEGRVFIIDFDNARPSWNPARIDYEELHYWYGLSEPIHS